MTHGREKEAERIMDEIEERVRRDGVRLQPVPASKAIEIRPTGLVSYLLTVSEIFPLELRGQAIAFFFAISQLAGGVAAPDIFAALIGNGTNSGPLTIGYFVGAGVVAAGGAIAWVFGVNAERKQLEDVAPPLSMVSGPAGRPGSAAAS